MPFFDYKAVNAAGKTVRGEMEAPDRKRLLARLQQAGLRPLSIEARSDARTPDIDAETEDLFAGEGRRSLLRVKRSRATLSLEFLKRLLVLIQSGMSLGDAVNLLSRRLTDPALQDLCATVWKRLSEGQTLAGALREVPDMFAPSTLHLIEAGETSGNLVAVLSRVVAYLEEAREVRNRMISSLLYPLFVLGVAAGVVVILLTVLLPRIRAMLDQLGGELPLITRLLIGTSEATIRYGPFIIAGLVIGSMAIRQWRRTASGRRTTDHWLLRLPVIGRIYLYASIYATTNLMSTLLGSGVNTTESLRLVERTIDNRILFAKFAAARKQIQEGVSMAAALQRVHFMPDMAMDILGVGENTGNIVSSLNDINRIYREELTRGLNFLTNATVAIALAFAITLVFIIAVSVVFSVLSVGQSIQL
jgi:type II secretory pathway component PulF